MSDTDDDTGCEITQLMRELGNREITADQLSGRDREMLDATGWEWE